MTTRRRVVAGLGFLAGAAGGVAAPAPAAAQARPASWPSTADLAAVPASESPAWVDGQGWFEAAAAEGEPDGVVRVAGPEGVQWRRSASPGVLRPEWFADAADDGDAARALQRAFDHAAVQGPCVVDLAGRAYACRSRLVLDPTRVALRGDGAVLDFSAMEEPAEAPPVLSVDTIQPDDDWIRDRGGLVHPDGPDTTTIHFLSLPAEGRYRVSILVSELSGTAQFPYLQVSVTAFDRRTLGAVMAVGPGHYCFEVDGAQSVARLTLESNAAVRIDRLDVTPQGLRECLLVQAGEDSPQYGHKWIEGLEVVGPGDGSRLHGIRFETRAAARSSRLEMRDITVRGFQTGLVFSHRSYLVHGYGVRVRCEVGLHFLGGSEDAGELISLAGSVIEGARVAVLGNDGEFLLDGTSIDFVDQVFVGSGVLTLQACHLELNRPTGPDRPPFDVSVGHVMLNGGVFLVTGNDFEAGNQCDHVFELRSRAATATLQDVSIYNLRSLSGALAGGPGRLDTARIRGRRPRHMAPIVQFDPSRNLLGPVPFDLRTSDGAGGGFTSFPLDQDSFKVSPQFRYVWLCGMARPGAEVGVAFEVKGDVAGEAAAMIQSLDGEVRATIGERWPFAIATDWAPVRANTGNTHPASAFDGRMPEGYPEVALMLDLSAYAGTVELRQVFLCAV